MARGKNWFKSDLNHLNHFKSVLITIIIVNHLGWPGTVSFTPDVIQKSKESVRIIANQKNQSKSVFRVHWEFSRKSEKNFLACFDKWLSINLKFLNLIRKREASMTLDLCFFYIILCLSFKSVRESVSVVDMRNSGEWYSLWAVSLQSIRRQRTPTGFAYKARMRKA